MIFSCLIFILEIWFSVRVWDDFVVASLKGCDLKRETLMERGFVAEANGSRGLPVNT
jgi:hypothetical protein